MGFIKILRWRIGGALNRLSSQPQPQDIGSLQRAAVFLIGLGEEHATLLAARLPDQERRLLAVEVNQFVDVDEELAEEVWSEFLHGLSLESLPGYVRRDELDEVTRAIVRANPQGAADRMLSLWFGDEPEQEVAGEDSGDDAFLEIGYEALEPAHKAAVFMMWLPPELSQMIFERFSPNIVHRITSIIVELPFVVPEARELVLADFMKGVTLGIPGLAIDDVGLPIVVEAFVRSNPEEVAKRLEKMWLSQSAVVVPAAPVEESSLAKPHPTAGMADLEKCAVFFQSLSLPLAYKLLALMEESEVERVLEQVDALKGVDSETRKAVLQELMLASKPGLKEEPQPIHVLGKAMGSMIRRRPQIVLAQLRKHWKLGSESEP